MQKIGIHSGLRESGRRSGENCCDVRESHIYSKGLADLRVSRCGELVRSSILVQVD